MQDELAARHLAITLASPAAPSSRSVPLSAAPSAGSTSGGGATVRPVPGLYDLTRANHHAQRIPPELERAILSIRRRLQAHATPTTRYSLIGAPPSSPN